MQLQHWEAAVVEQLAHHVILPLCHLEHHLRPRPQPARMSPSGQEAQFQDFRGEDAVTRADSVAELLSETGRAFGGPRNVTVDDGRVPPRHLTGWAQQPLGQLAMTTEEQQPSRVPVQPTHRVVLADGNPWIHSSDGTSSLPAWVPWRYQPWNNIAEVHAALMVFHGAYDMHRLVIFQEQWRITIQQYSIHGEGCSSWQDCLGVLNDLPVERHTTRLYQLSLLLSGRHSKTPQFLRKA
mmetsp:Transcript_15172/g.47837  ORF Transcript_15172/g.47837 Transcript_15172/m.47837 type:complete len:238 (+) Transcript_15172:264-977(+)